MADSRIQQYSSDAHAEHGVLPPVSSQMKVELLIDKGGTVFIKHDRRFAGEIEWIEYDQETGRTIFLFKDGHVQDLGLILPDNMSGSDVLKSGTAFLVYMKDGRKQDLDVVRIIVRSAAFV